MYAYVLPSIVLYKGGCFIKESVSMKGLDENPEKD